MFLYHYFDKSTGPFVNLSDLPIEEAKSVLDTIKKTKPNSQSAQRHDKYVEYRRNCEKIIRTEFIKKGGLVKKSSPHYMVVEHSPWLSTWFKNSAFIKIPIEEFDLKTVSFTYGDSMPTFSFSPHKDQEEGLAVYSQYPIFKYFGKAVDKESGLCASDHYGVFAELQMPYEEGKCEKL